MGEIVILIFFQIVNRHFFQKVGQDGEGAGFGILDGVSSISSAERENAVSFLSGK
jgi:hypothetical protein